MMHPDKRRAGRAIRKARRLQHERTVSSASASVSALAAAFRSLSAALTPSIDAMDRVAVAIAQVADLLRPRDDASPNPTTPVVGNREPGTGIQNP